LLLLSFNLLFFFSGPAWRNFWRSRQQRRHEHKYPDANEAPGLQGAEGVTSFSSSSLTVMDGGQCNRPSRKHAYLWRLRFVSGPSC
jgi:hypothetical protein